MSITRQSILDFANAAMGTTDSPYTGTDLDIQIQAALDDLAGMHAILAEDTTQSVTVADFYLPYPSDCLGTDQAIKSVVLTDSGLSAYPGLRHLPGGWDAYTRLMEQFTASGRSTPTYMVRCNRRIYLFPAPDDTYTGSIWYYKAAQAIALGVDFPDDWRNAIQFGAVYYTHFLAGSAEGMNIWEPRFQMEKERMRLRISRDTGMIG